MHNLMHLDQNTMKLQSKNHIVKLTEVNGKQGQISVGLGSGHAWKYAWNGYGSFAHIFVFGISVGLLFVVHRSFLCDLQSYK